MTWHFALLIHFFSTPPAQQAYVYFLSIIILYIHITVYLFQMQYPQPMQYLQLLLFSLCTVFFLTLCIKLHSLYLFLYFCILFLPSPFVYSTTVNFPFVRSIKNVSFHLILTESVATLLLSFLLCKVVTCASLYLPNMLIQWVKLQPTGERFISCTHSGS